MVDYVFQLLAGLEIRNLFRWNLYASAGFGITADARLALAGSKTAKAADFDLVAGAQRAHYTVKNRFHDNLAVLASQLRQARDFFDEIGFGHSPLFHPKWGSASRIVSSHRRPRNTLI